MLTVLRSTGRTQVAGVLTAISSIALSIGCRTSNNVRCMFRERRRMTGTKRCNSAQTREELAEITGAPN